MVKKRVAKEVASKVKEKSIPTLEIEEEVSEEEMITEAIEVLADSPELAEDELEAPALHVAGDVVIEGTLTVSEKKEQAQEVLEQIKLLESRGFQPAVEEEAIVEVDPIVAKTLIVEKQHEMFYNLEEGRINLEDQEREKEAVRKAKELEAEEQERLNNAGKPSLTCPFCQHVQFELNSKDVTTSWCMNCGRAFMVNWK